MSGLQPSVVCVTAIGPGNPGAFFMLDMKACRVLVFYYIHNTEEPKMHLVKILVEDYGQAEEVCELIADAEELGELDFPFAVRITESMSQSAAKDELMYEHE